MAKTPRQKKSAVLTFPKLVALGTALALVSGGAAMAAIPPDTSETGVEGSVEAAGVLNENIPYDTDALDNEVGSGTAVVEFVPALVTVEYLEAVERTDESVTEDQLAGVFNAQLMGEEEEGLVPVNLARLDVDPRTVDVDVWWEGEAEKLAPTYLRVLSEGIWSPWEEIDAGEEEGLFFGEPVDLPEGESVEIMTVVEGEAVALPSVDLTWEGIQAPKNSLADLLLTEEAPAEGVEEGESEEIAEESVESEEVSEAPEAGENEETTQPIEEEEAEEGTSSKDQDQSEEETQTDLDDANAESEEVTTSASQEATAPETAALRTLVLEETKEASSFSLTSTPALSSSEIIARWNPGFIISDASFYNANALTEAQIQAFILEKGSSCTSSSSATCLKDLTVGQLSLTSKFSSGIGCRPLNLTGTSNKPWTAVKRVAEACDISPEVLLVFIQKESSGIFKALSTSSWNKMMGMGCPDNQGCDSQYSGFANQLYYGADALTSYRYRGFKFNEAAKSGTPVAVPYHSGNPACGTQTFVIQNQATASLYTYNPAVPNQAALNNYPVAGNSCSTYGQLNVFMYMWQWFPGSMGGGGLGSGLGSGNPDNTTTEQTPPAESIASFTGSSIIGKDFPAATVFAGDWDKNGYVDLMSIRPGGQLMFHRGVGGEQFAAPVQIGHGWQGMTWVQGGVDWNGDGNLDVLARQADGKLFLYPGNGRGGFYAKRQVGHGWQNLQSLTLAPVAGGNGIYAMAGTDLLLYPGNGTGGFMKPRKVGSGWGAMSALTGVRDWSGDGIPDLLARRTDGRLFLYRGTETGALRSGVHIGSGWGNMAVLGSSDQTRSKAPLWAVHNSGSLYSYKVK